MSKCLCRMITFVNYHAPSTLLKGVNKPSYVTMGFFDGMLTEVVPLDYGRTDLKPLWKQSIRVSGQSKGAYSCQNTFCFSQDDWSSSASDSDFWDVLTDKQYPLCFIVYFQIRNYAEGANGVADQCRRFNWALRKAMDEAELAGEYYTYATIDKNDVVVCIKSSQYKKTVGVIKKLHDGNAQIVYSYTVLSVNRDILGSISQDTTPELFCEIIDSICLKGIANSCRCQGRYLRLDDKYKDFCEKLIDRLGNPKDYRIYDILGESDFRLIARDVQFGRILNVLADGELLSCDNSYYKFCLYISELLLNTEAASTGMDPGVDIRGWNDSFEIQTQAELCRKLAERMEQMNRKLAGIDAPDADEKAVTFSSAIRQLDYSLCALEAAPTKKYDFYSIYEPLETLVSILEDKLAESEDVGEYMLIYDFIHKISMTFHGTLRTDIQFFQIRDFNVIVHYAPTKLRAFYSLWTTKAAYFFERAGGQREGSHKFVVAPGMFGRTSVKELFPESEKTKSLMLITIPERNLYIPKWMVIVLTHEVSHFVGGNLRRREEREGYVFSILARIMELEVKELAKEELMDCFPESGKYLGHNELMVSGRLNEYYLENRNWIYAKNKIRKEEQHHFKNTEHLFQMIFRDYAGLVGKKDIMAFVNRLKTEALAFQPDDGRVKQARKATEIFDALFEDLQTFYNLFQSGCLRQAVDQLRVDMGETYADVAAILTLQLFPEEYLLTFLRSDNHKERYPDGGVNLTHPLMLRCYVVMTAVGNVAQDENTAHFFRKEWIRAWSEDDLIATLGEKFERGSREWKKLAELHSFRAHMAYMDDDGQNYGAVYNRDIKSFDNYVLNFYKDKKVAEIFEQYLELCARFYVEKLAEDAEAVRLRKTLLPVYRGVSADNDGKGEEDLMRVIQTIEDFLATYGETIKRESGQTAGQGNNKKESAGTDG